MSTYVYVYVRTHTRTHMYLADADLAHCPYGHQESDTQCLPRHAAGHAPPPALHTHE